MKTIIKSLVLSGFLCSEAVASFECTHEIDTAPALNQSADIVFQQARARSKELLPDWTQIAQLYQQAVNKDHWKAMHNLAELYLRGNGVAKDTNKAIDLNSRMAELEVPLGYYDMSVMMQRGVGVIQSDKNALSFLQKAAITGNPNAQTHIGMVYVYEKQEHTKGLPYLRCAANQHFASANYELANYYEILDRNYPVEMHYYQIAASLGEAKGALSIRNTFRDGDFQYNKDEKTSQAYYLIFRSLLDNPSARFPNLATDHPHIRFRAITQTKTSIGNRVAMKTIIKILMLSGISLFRSCYHHR